MARCSIRTGVFWAAFQTTSSESSSTKTPCIIMPSEWSHPKSTALVRR